MKSYFVLAILVGMCLQFYLHPIAKNRIEMYLTIGSYQPRYD